MPHPVLDAPISKLRQRLIDDMTMRRFSQETQRNYIRDVGRFASFLGRSPHTATADDLRRFQVGQQDDGVPVPTMNSIVSALRFFFTHTLDRPDFARRLVRVSHPRKLPVVLSRDEVARLLLEAPGSAVGRLRCGPARCRGIDARARPEKGGMAGQITLASSAVSAFSLVPETMISKTSCSSVILT
jgi:integrase